MLAFSAYRDYKITIAYIQANAALDEARQKTRMVAKNSTVNPVQIVGPVVKES